MAETTRKVKGTADVLIALRLMISRWKACKYNTLTQVTVTVKYDKIKVFLDKTSQQSTDRFYLDIYLL